MADNSLSGGQKALEILKKMKDFITKHANIFCILALLLFGYLFLFLNLGSYRH